MIPGLRFPYFVPNRLFSNAGLFLVICIVEINTIIQKYDLYCLKTLVKASLQTPPVSDLGLKKYGGILRQIHKLNKYIRYFVLRLCKEFPHHSGKCGGFLEKMGEKANPPLWIRLSTTS